MSFQAMTWAVKQELPAMQKIVLLMMSNRANPETGACFPSLQTLAKECGMSIRSVVNQIALLKAANLIEVENNFRKDKGQTSNSYLLNFEKEVKFRDLPKEEDVLANEPPIFSPNAEDANGVAPNSPLYAPDANKTVNINNQNKQTTSESNARASVAEFVPPLAQDVFNYWAAMCLLLPMEQAESFIDHYASVGWMSGKTPIVDWYAKARSWAARKKNEKLTPKNYTKPTKSDFHNPPKYSLDDDFGDSNAIDSIAMPVFQIGGA